MRTIERILDLSRWAPSGDNSQPWRFELLDDRRVRIHGFDTRDWCLYDIDGRPSQIAHGALLETMAIAAGAFGMRVDHVRRSASPPTRPQYDVVLAPSGGAAVDPLAAFIETRSVQRRPLARRPLSDDEKLRLESAAGAMHQLRWFDRPRDRRAFARLLFDSAKLRLTAPEAYEVHRRVIAWNSRYSDDKVPDRALGLDPATVRLMRWVMQSWGRVRFFNRFLAGTLAPRIQMDYIPALACAGHFAIVARERVSGVDDFVAAGRAMQRVWLTATSLGLQVQPEMTPLIFRWYVGQDRPFTRDRGVWRKAGDVARRFDGLMGADAASAVFIGRIGAGKPAIARSRRLPLGALMVQGEKVAGTLLHQPQPPLDAALLGRREE